ncbi:MAG: hypothetical protein KGQ41_01675 [Alphaproteobacteria bacterium]|nr:hypothetical protein [Alphaproteobacteria bacterium]
MARKKQGDSLGEETRAKVAQSLPDAIDHAMQSYRLFSNQNVSTDAKEFSAHHAACKTAIAHIELLLKLAAWAKLPDKNTDGELATLLSDAEEELRKYNETGGEDDDE